jgi:hypothetical protein
MNKGLHFTEHATGIKDSVGREVYLGDCVILTQSSEAYSGGSKYAFITRVGNKPTAWNAPEGRFEITRISNYGIGDHFMSTFVDSTSIVVVNETMQSICPNFEENKKKVFEKINPEKVEAKMKHEYYMIMKQAENPQDTEFVVIKASGTNSKEIQEDSIKKVSEYKGFCRGYSVGYNKSKETFKRSYGVNSQSITMLKQQGFDVNQVGEILNKNNSKLVEKIIEDCGYDLKHFQYEYNTIN